jgi:hypothetical protein
VSDTIFGDDDLTAAERELVACYERLVATLRVHGDELPPFAQRNAIKATAALWQVANGLGRRPGQLYDIGV